MFIIVTDSCKQNYSYFQIYGKKSMTFGMGNVFSDFFFNK